MGETSFLSFGGILGEEVNYLAYDKELYALV
jgi:hypothetical protein